MGLGASLFLIAAGTILRWGVTGSVAGANLHAIGWILMIIGIVGLVISMIFWSSWGGWGGAVGRSGLATRVYRALRGSTFAPRTTTSK